MASLYLICSIFCAIVSVIDLTVAIETGRIGAYVWTGLCLLFAWFNFRNWKRELLRKKENNEHIEKGRM